MLATTAVSRLAEGHVQYYFRSIISIHNSTALDKQTAAFLQSTLTLLLRGNQERDSILGHDFILHRQALVQALFYFGSLLRLVSSLTLSLRKKNAQRVLGNLRCAGQLSIVKYNTCILQHVDDKGFVTILEIAE